MVPIVVWWHHGTEPQTETRQGLIDALAQVADRRFGSGNWYLDENMRQLPDHFHAHARDHNWWTKRSTRPMSRYRGVGAEPGGQG